MSYKVYILYSYTHKRTYVGCSGDITARLQKHNAGQVAATRNFRPWKLVYEEPSGNYTEARKREKYYKSGAGRRKIKGIFDALGINK